MKNLETLFADDNQNHTILSNSMVLHYIQVTSLDKKDLLSLSKKIRGFRNIFKLSKLSEEILISSKIKELINLSYSINMLNSSSLEQKTIFISQFDLENQAYMDYILFTYSESCNYYFLGNLDAFLSKKENSTNISSNISSNISNFGVDNFIFYNILVFFYNKLLKIKSLETWDLDYIDIFSKQDRKIKFLPLKISWTCKEIINIYLWKNIIDCYDSNLDLLFNGLSKISDSLLNDILAVKNAFDLVKNQYTKIENDASLMPLDIKQFCIDYEYEKINIIKNTHKNLLAVKPFFEISMIDKKEKEKIVLDFCKDLSYHHITLKNNNLKHLTEIKEKQKLISSLEEDINNISTKLTTSLSDLKERDVLILRLKKEKADLYTSTMSRDENYKESIKKLETLNVQLSQKLNLVVEKHSLKSTSNKKGLILW